MSHHADRTPSAVLIRSFDHFCGHELEGLEDVDDAYVPIMAQCELDLFDGTVELAQYNVKATGHVARLRRDLGIDPA